MDEPLELPHCAACGALQTAEGVALGPSVLRTNGAPDLDLRSAEADLTELREWVATCSTCGYCNTLVGELIDSEQDAAEVQGLLATDRYKTVLRDPRFPPLANRFRCLALLQTSSTVMVSQDLAALSLLYGAWVCDDFAALGAGATGVHPAQAATQARQLRREAAQLLRSALEAGRTPLDDTGLGWLVLADLYRRAESFPSAHTATVRGLGVAEPGSVLEALLNHEQQLAADLNTSVGCMADAFAPDTEAG